MSVRPGEAPAPDGPNADRRLWRVRFNAQINGWLAAVIILPVVLTAAVIFWPSQVPLARLGELLDFTVSAISRLR